MLRRRRYLTKNKAFLKTRKLYRRAKPAWMVRRLHHKTEPPKAKITKPVKRTTAKPRTKPKVFKPKLLKPRKPKIHAPKRV
jgi:hypothetical protein